SATPTPKWELLDYMVVGLARSQLELWNLQRKTTMSLLNHAEFKKLVDKTMWNGMHKKLIRVLDYMTEKGLKTDLQNIFQRLTFDVTMDLVLDYDPETLSVDLPYNVFDVAITNSYKKKQKKLLNVDSFEKEQLEDVRLVTDTTSSSLTWFFYLLAKNPIVEGKIYQEIHAHLGMKEGEKWKSFGKKELEMLVYLHGALCEALRLFPPGPANPRSPQEADTLPSGHQVHTHTRIVLHPYAMGQMETIWGPDCLEFRPERWISEQGGIKHMPSYKFTAFHSGPRTCLGKDMSLIHMKMVAATIIYNYNVQVVEGHPTTQDPSMILQMKYGLMVTLTKKNR
ncbi:cytochrome P450, partial [Tanacetum coccineum]